MNDQQLETKVRKDSAKVKKDLTTLLEDRTTQLTRLGYMFNQATGKAKEDVTTWVGDSTTQLSERFEKLKGDAQKTAVTTAATVKKDVGHGLSQYNTKAQEVANKVPGGFGKKASRYPWVAMSIALAVGFLLGNLLKPTRQSIR